MSMDPRFHVVTVLHPGGERLPILLDEGGNQSRG